MNTEINKQNEDGQQMAEFKKVRQYKFHKIRNVIKELSSKQVDTKSQRKTVRFTGERTMTASEAQHEADKNAKRLLNLFQAYAILKNKVIPVPQMHCGYHNHSGFDMELIKKLVIEYKPEDVVEQDRLI